MEGDNNPAILGSNKKRLVLSGILIVIVILGIYFFWSKPFGFVGKFYTESYVLVDDKISQSAAIIINLPKGVPKLGAEKLVTFTPALAGNWKEISGSDDSLAFMPNTPLEIGKRYTANLSMETGAISKDFVIDEDPKVLEVFPRADSEAPEHSSVTIIFNRPMVPLTTLSQLESKKLPIQITPQTEGVWKWISTRTLQFIPKTALAYSAHYSVKILQGFTSTDGVPVPVAEYKFTTRALRFEIATSGEILYDQPIQIDFNVPIDLPRTTQGLTLKNNKTGALVPFIAEYGKRYEYDEKGAPKSVVVDRSILSVFLKSDQNGRNKIWDFGGAYSVNLNGAYPLGGDINFSGSVGVSVTITPAIKSVSAVSARTTLASQNLFDPQGSLVVDFYEDIDLGKTDISAKNLKDVKYGKICKPNDAVFDAWQPESDTCEKVDNKSEIILSFNPSAFALGESFPVIFKKIVNIAGLTINSAPISETVSVYPKLSILSITPKDGSADGSLTNLYVCTNSPLAPSDKTNFKTAISTNGYLVFNRWDNSYVKLEDPPNYPSGIPCNPGEYVNGIHYGLHPETRYAIQLNFSDTFGQTAGKLISFTSAKPKAFYARFYNLQKVYNVTTPDKTKFTYAVENLDYVNLHICQVSPQTMLGYLNQRPDPTAGNDSLNCILTKTDRIDLPKVYWVNNYFQIDLSKYLSDPRGQYVISFSNPLYVTDTGSWRNTAKMTLYDRTFVSVTALAVGEKKTQWTKYDENPAETSASFSASGSDANLYWVSNAQNLSPIAGASVKVYQQSGDYNGPIYPGAGAVTGADGVAKLPLSKDIVGAVITAGDDSAIISSWTDNLQWASYATGNKMVYAYTDRPIYRPGQDVYIKGIYRFQFDGRYDSVFDKSISVSVSNSKGESVLNQDVLLSDFGTFVTHLKLPDNASLGTYNIQAGNGYFYFDVAEYQSSAFEVISSADKDEYVAGDTANISVAGKYYFGVPLAGGKLQYSWTAQDYYFDRYADEYFNFGSDWYYCQNCGYGDSYIGSGQTTLDISGKAKVSEKFDFSKLFTGDSSAKSKIIVLHGTISDLNGKSVSFQKSFIVHRADFYIGLKTDPSFAPTNQPIIVKVKTVNDKGEPVGENNLKLVASKVEWKSAKRQEVDGGFYNQYERVLTAVMNKNLSTNGSGDGLVALTFKDPGEYQIDMTSNDSRGNPVTASTGLYVYGEGVASVAPGNNATLDVTAEKKSVNVGETAKIILKSPYPHAKALITIERGGIFKYEIVNVDQNFFEYNVPILDEYAPNVYVSVLLLSPNPEIKFGQVELRVNTSRKALTISVATDKKSYLPGEKVTLSIHTVDYSGAPASAEVSVAVADLSVLALKGNLKKDPLIFFYNGLPLTVTTASNIKNILQEKEIPIGTKGGDGGNPADLARKKRGEFKDTAFWKGNVVTDSNGVATVTFTLPDNLTRWQIESVGVTKDTKVGANYVEFTAAKKVMALPLAPRFVIPGDEFSIGVNVFNQTESTQPLTVTLDSKTLILSGNTKQSVNLKAGESSTLYFKVNAPTSISTGKHTFTLSAKNGNYEDTVDGTIPVKRNETFESVATAGSTKNDSVSEYVFVPDDVLVDRGAVTVRAQASLAFFLTDAISYMAQFPYGCSEQMASKLGMLAVLQKANSLKGVGSKFTLPFVEFDGTSYSVADAVSEGLARIYENQDISGGFSYYQGLPPDLALSAHIVGVLADLKSAGFAVSDTVLQNAGNYVANALVKRGTLYYTQNPQEIDGLIISAEALSRLQNSPNALSQVLGMVSAKVSPAFLSDKISSSALASLAILIKNAPSLSNLPANVWKILDNRIDIDSRGAYLKSNQNNISYEYYETSVKNTALLIKAIAKRGVDHSQVDSMLRWLFASRDKTGAWGSTNATLSVIDGVVEYLDWSKEGQSSFSLQMSLDGAPIVKKDFSGDSFSGTLEKVLPISQFELNKNHKISFDRTNNVGAPSNFYYDIGMTYYLPTENIPPRDEGIMISRNYYVLTDTQSTRPILEAKVGDVVRGEIRLITPKPRSLFAVEDFIPAGFELIDFNLSTEDQSVIDSQSGKPAVGKNSGFYSVLSSAPFRNLLGAIGAAYDTSLPQIYEEDLAKKEQIQTLVPDFKELHDDRLFLFNQNLPAGEYVYNYYARVTTAGTFRELPAVASELYFPEIFGRTEGNLFKVNQ